MALTSPGQLLLRAQSVGRVTAVFVGPAMKELHHGVGSGRWRVSIIARMQLFPSCFVSPALSYKDSEKHTQLALAPAARAAMARIFHMMAFFEVFKVSRVL